VDEGETEVEAIGDGSCSVVGVILAFFFNIRNILLFE
jgi:hypothetical protein